MTAQNSRIGTKAEDRPETTLPSASDHSDQEERLAPTLAAAVQPAGGSSLVPPALSQTGSAAGARIGKAGQRIEQALARLDVNIGRYTSLLEQREEESRQLFDALKRLKTDHEELLVAANAVANRLDGAVERVDAVLEEDRQNQSLQNHALAQAREEG